MSQFESYHALIKEIKKEGNLSEAVKLYLAGMQWADCLNKLLTVEEVDKLSLEMDYQRDKYLGVEELALSGKLIEWADRKINFTQSDLNS